MLMLVLNFLAVFLYFLLLCYSSTLITCHLFFYFPAGFAINPSRLFTKACPDNMYLKDIIFYMIGCSCLVLFWYPKKSFDSTFLFLTYFLEFFNQTLTVDLHTNTKIQESYTSNNLDKIHETKRRLLQWVLRFEYHRTTGHCSPSPRILF